MADDWCPENDGAYRAEMAALHRDNVDQQLLRARAEIERLRAVLTVMVYETTHLSAEEADGSHWCRISKEALTQARAALAQKGYQP